MSELKDKNQNNVTSTKKNKTPQDIYNDSLIELGKQVNKLKEIKYTNNLFFRFTKGFFWGSDFALANDEFKKDKEEFGLDFARDMQGINFLKFRYWFFIPFADTFKNNAREDQRVIIQNNKELIKLSEELLRMYNKELQNAKNPDEVKKIQEGIKRVKEIQDDLNNIEYINNRDEHGGFGGGGSSPGSEMTEDQYSEYLKDYFHDPEDPNETYYRNKLKEDPSVNRMHYDPSQMTEGQQAELIDKRKAA